MTTGRVFCAAFWRDGRVTSHAFDSLFAIQTFWSQNANALVRISYMDGMNINDSRFAHG